LGRLVPSGYEIKPNNSGLFPVFRMMIWRVFDDGHLNSVCVRFDGNTHAATPRLVATYANRTGACARVVEGTLSGISHLP
jgi:hypothetical protein